MEVIPIVEFFSIRIGQYEISDLEIRQLDPEFCSPPYIVDVDYRLEKIHHARDYIEAFCMLVINAWELLLKAEICMQKGEKRIYYPGDETKSISISDAVKRQLQNPNDPVRKNIESMIVLRDKAVHLLIPEINRNLSRLFQSAVLNYHERYIQLVGDTPVELMGPRHCDAAILSYHIYPPA